jgi:hypothetical protein
MPLFICRWQNGDFSAVSASSKKDAIELLDEVGNAGTCELITMETFMVHCHCFNPAANRLHDRRAAAYILCSVRDFRAAGVYERRA